VTPTVAGAPHAVAQPRFARVVEGRDALRAFVARVFAHQPAERRCPDGDQMDFAEVMEIRDGRIARHRVYWGWKGVGMLVRGEHGR
jgi:hypothetical protein